MVVMVPGQPSFYPPIKRRRRTATSVCAGDHDPRPRRDILTSLLNGVPSNPEAEMRGLEHGRRGLAPQPAQAPVEKAPVIAKKRGRPPKVRPAPPTASAPQHVPAVTPTPTTAPIRRPTAAPMPPPAALPTLDPSIYGMRPHVHLPQDHRSRSFSPPPIATLSRPSTPGPSISSSTTRTSSKRPHTPDDGFLDPAFRDNSSMTPEPNLELLKRPPRKKRNTATRKGWKGWVEISEDEEEASSKLISSEAPLILSEERRTRSGRVV